MHKFVGTFTAFSIAALPLVASAKTLFDTLGFASTFLNGVIGLFITLAIVIFFWGLIKYLTAVSDKKADGLSIMFYGVIAIFVMVSIWGLIALLQNSFGVGGGSAPPVPVPPTDYIPTAPQQ